ncbi:hypothetical protein CERSUDRAFT_49182 [Gelatoporia subvermispora B]|uniref:tRNA(Ile)-lysidine synthetase n=1 Tax=Ceriporiopsis subvermispora (strain B) TaxID=914234 RepID=M2QMC4_CERS8|nr:hypothetical protein CERSUDRAFT_49182 [Gelatoporia subvermispora B]
MPPILPISGEEFLHYFRQCTPPRGWPPVLAVANSGGPDSTCLLYLLATLLKNTVDRDELPSEVVSVHVNHDLQKPSVTMAEVAEGTARTLGVKHLVTKVQWGAPPFPPRPAAGAPIEEIARYARHYALFRAMSESRAEAITYGHHADDQVETVVMRLAKGSGSHGLAGIRPVRRWGMGEATPLADFGLEGMRRWIVRPLLGVSKGRILATCEANCLPYTNDPTNFQPDLTIRNAIRHLINGTGNHESSAITGGAMLDEFPHLREALRTLRDLAARSERHGNVWEAVSVLAQRAHSSFFSVTTWINQSVLPSPPSTLLLPSKELLKITDGDVRRALVRRVLRFVSPRPWGSLSAEVGGSRTHLDHAVSKAWGYEDKKIRRSFSSGSDVLWVPHVLRSDGLVKEQGQDLTNGEPLWLVQRAPPFLKNIHLRKDKSDALVLDITDYVAGRLPLEILWDNRFGIELDPAVLPDHVVGALNCPGSSARVTIQPHTKWYLPRLVLSCPDQPDKVLADFHWNITSWKHKRPANVHSDPQWVRMAFVRSWDAV